MPATRSSVSPSVSPSLSLSMSPPAPNSTGHPPRWTGLEKEHGGGSPGRSAPVPPTSPWGLPLSKQEEPLPWEVVTRGGGAGLAASRRRWPHGTLPYRGGDGGTEAGAAGTRPESRKPTRAAQGCSQIKSAPQDHRPPCPQTQYKKNEEAGEPHPAERSREFRKEQGNKPLPSNR